MAFWKMKELHALPKGGGYLDQDVGILGQMTYLDGVFTTVKRFATGARMQKEENDLILSLTKAGLMGTKKKKHGRNLPSH